MALSVKKSKPTSDEIDQLKAQVEQLKARLERMEGKSPNGNGDSTPHSRRDLLKLAGAAAAGAAGTVLLRGVPASATTGLPLVLGNNTTNDANATTTIFPTSTPNPSSPTPLFQATGQGVNPGITVPATISTSGPASQSIPLIGAIGPGGSLPPIGQAGVPDYPGFAPIQGVGGDTTINPSSGAEKHSEGLNGWGYGDTGFGVTGESDFGYGVMGAAQGGIDLSAQGSGRVHQVALSNFGLTNPPAGPPNYAPNDFEQVRDQNGVLYISLPLGVAPGYAWVPVQAGGLNQTIFTAFTTKLLALYGPNDGDTFVDMLNDTAYVPAGGPDLNLNITPLFDCIALITGNASLYSGTPGYHQSFGIYVSGSTAPQSIVAWQEAGQPQQELPNAAFVQAVYPMTRGTAYNVRLKWKPNVAMPSGAVIRAGAGPFPKASGLTSVSPTRLTVLLIVTA